VFQQVMATLFSSYVKDGNNSACLVQLLWKLKEAMLVQNSRGAWHRATLNKD
jgi:hypothetical protein